jgi:hypothetical protein
MFDSFKDVTAVNAGGIMRESGMDFIVDDRRLRYWSQDEDRDVDSHKAIINLGSSELLGIVGKDYRIVNNRTVCDAAMNIAESLGGKIGKAGVMHSKSYALGSRIGFHSDLGGFDVGGDEMRKQMFITSSHDGSSSLTVRLAVFRLICTNGMMAFDDSVGNCIKIRHKGDINIAIRHAIDKIRLAEGFFTRTRHDLEKMRTRGIMIGEVERFTEKLFPRTQTQKTGDRLIVTPQTAKKRLRIVELYKEQDLPNRDVYRLYQACTEYVDHDRTIRIRKSSDVGSTAFDNITAGTGNNLKKKAYELCMEMSE